MAHGSRPHPFVISFDLPGPPAGVFNLTIDLLFKSAGVPQYVVEINGRKGRFFPSPKLSEEIGDPETAWNIVFSRQRLNLALPASFFRAGSNRLVLTCVDDNSKPILAPTQASGAESGLYYDALELSNDDHKANPRQRRKLMQRPPSSTSTATVASARIVTLKASTRRASYSMALRP